MSYFFTTEFRNEWETDPRLPEENQTADRGTRKQKP